MSLIDQKVPDVDWRILVVARDTDAPLITALSDDLIPFSIVHKIGETFVRVQSLRRALEKASMNIQELVLLYAMAGCDYLPTTNHVSEFRYLSAFWRHRAIIGQLYRSDHALEVSMFNEMSWKPFENLVIAAYVLCYSTEENNGMDKLDPTSASVPGSLGWGNNIRRWIAAIQRVTCPTETLPMSEDIELQSRRAMCLLKYWSQANRFACDKEAVGGLSSGSWFSKNVSVLFEPRVAILSREKALKKDMQVCGCRTGCLPNRCGCRKRGFLHLLCVKCGTSCTNRGGDGEEVLPVTVEEIRDSDDEEESASDSEHQDEEESSDSSGDDSCEE